LDRPLEKLKSGRELSNNWIEISSFSDWIMRLLAD
jgi:hypothetical protein